MKTGLVERSGQGVDKIFSITLSEGKSEPDYKTSDLFQVSLVLKTEITNKAFHIFISQYQNSSKEPKLGIEQIITLHKINNGISQGLNHEIINQLERIGMIEKVSGHTSKYILSNEYQVLSQNELTIGSRYIVKEVELLMLALQGKQLKMGDLEEQLSNSLNRNQLKYITTKLVDDNILIRNGKGSGSSYNIARRFEHLRGNELVNKVADYLRLKQEA